MSNVQVNGCYYHTNKSAVAVCAECGAGVCENCAVKDDRGRIICVSCGNAIYKEEQKQYRQMLKEQGGRFTNGKEFIKPGIIGLILIFGALFLVFHEGTLVQEFHTVAEYGDISGLFACAVALLLFGYMIFSIPFAFSWMLDALTPNYVRRWDFTAKWYFRVWAALFFGWIIFTFYWIRFVIIKIKRKRTKKKQERIQIAKLLGKD